MAPTRFTGAVRVHERGGFVAYGDYLELSQKLETAERRMRMLEDPSAWPPMPLEVAVKQDEFRGQQITQTHCRLEWTIADADGAVLFEHKRARLICRSDDGSASLKPLKPDVNSLLVELTAGMQPLVSNDGFGGIFALSQGSEDVSLEVYSFEPGRVTLNASGRRGHGLATIDPAKYGGRVREVWFGDDGWQHLEGEAMDEADIIAFAIADPDARATEDDEPASAAELHKALSGLAAAMRMSQQRIGYVKGSPTDKMVRAAEKMIAKGT